MIYINTVCEDFLSEIVVEKIIDSFDDKFFITSRYITDGNGAIKRNLLSYSHASQFTPFCVVTDLDQNVCASELISSWSKGVALNSKLIFRVAVREVEAWILSDSKAFSKYTGINEKHLPDNPEKLADPKRTLLELVNSHGKKKVREDLLPRNDLSTIGPNYNLSLGQFVHENWSAKNAAKKSQSLARMLRALQNFK